MPATSLPALAAERLLLLLLLLLQLLPSALASLPAPSTLVRLDHPRAKCIDGSPGVFYLSPGSNKTAFLFHLQGGGWCQTLDECSERAKGPLGSSRGYGPTMDLRTVDPPPTAPGGHDQFDRDCAINPLMCDWTYVYLPYCDGQSFAGDATGASVRGGVPVELHFRGKQILRSAVDALKVDAEANLGGATHVVVTGCSAGGAATLFHTDWFAAQVPGAMTRGMPDSGWFLDGAYARDGKGDYGGRMSNLYRMANVSAGLPPACTAVRGEKCLFAETVMPFIKTPVFVINSKFDASMAPGAYARSDGKLGKYTCAEYMQDTAHGCDATGMNDFGDYITATMKKLLRPPHGAYLDSCYRHCGQCTDQLGGHGLGALSPLAAFKLWFETGSLHPAAADNFLDQGMPFPCDDCCRKTGEPKVAAEEQHVV